MQLINPQLNAHAFCEKSSITGLLWWSYANAFQGSGCWDSVLCVCVCEGIMAILFCGIVMSHYTHLNLSPVTQITTQLTFRTIAFIAGAMQQLTPQGQYWAGKILPRTTYLPIWPPMTFLQWNATLLSCSNSRVQIVPRSFDNIKHTERSSN